MKISGRCLPVPLFSDHARGGEEQMDLDRSFLARMSTGDGRTPTGPFSLLRVYRIHPGHVTVGRTYRGELPAGWAISPGGSSLRPTGGGAVLHGRDICFSLFLPSRPNAPLLSVYSFLHRFLGRFVGDLGIDWSLGGTPEVPGDGRGTCFLEPVCGDLMAGSEKILGGAMRVTRQGFLYQGSLMVPVVSAEKLLGAFVSWYSGANRLFLHDGNLDIAG